MRNCLMAIFILLFTLAAGTAGAYSASVHIYVYNDDYESHQVDVEHSGGYKLVTIDSNGYYEFEFSATAWFYDEKTYEYDVYVYDSDSTVKYCTTSIAVATEWDLGVDLKQCTATSSQTDACTIKADSYGTTCQVEVIIND